MYRVFRKKDRDKATGKLLLSAKYYVEFRDHLDRVHRTPATTDKFTSQQFARNLERLVNHRMSHEPPAADLMQWVGSLPKAYARRLVEGFGLLDADRIASRQPLGSHLEAFRDRLAARGRSSNHVEHYYRRTKRLLDAMKAKTWADLTRERVEATLLSIEGRGRALTPQSRNHYFAAVRAFCNFMVATGRATSSPLTGLRPLPFAEREYRRALSADEVRVLIASTSSTGVQECWSRDRRLLYRLTGPERALLYALVIQTGMRAGEVASLRARDFDLGQDRPTVTLTGTVATKHRKTRRVPLQRDLAMRLAAHLQGHEPSDPAFFMPDSTGTAKMLRRDMATARAAWIAAGGTEQEKLQRGRSAFLRELEEQGRRVDFHALRTTTASMLAELAVPQAIAQRILGHANYATTAKHYVRVQEQGLADAVAELPILSSLMLPAEQRAGGTRGQK